MKTIPNRITGIPSIKEGEPPPAYADLLRVALDSMPQGGFSLEEMRKRARIDKALEAVKPGGEIVLEDADYAAAQEVLRAVRWVNRHRDYLALSEAFGL